MGNPIPDDAGWYLDEYDGERFWSHVNRHGGTPYEDDPLATAKGECWLWRGTDEYANFKLFGKTYPVHRIAFRDFGHNLPDELSIDHLCRIHSCVNPAHLDPVTQEVNTDRGLSGRPARTTCLSGHPYSVENTIWRERKNGTRFRICRICLAESKHRTYERRKASL